jgi:hypothetical protein
MPPPALEWPCALQLRPPSLKRGGPREFPFSGGLCISTMRDVDSSYLPPLTPKNRSVEGDAASRGVVLDPPELKIAHHPGAAEDAASPGAVSDPPELKIAHHPGAAEDAASPGVVLDPPEPKVAMHPGGEVDGASREVVSDPRELKFQQEFQIPRSAPLAGRPV